MWDFITSHWSWIFIVISELLAFVPARYNGIAQVILKILVAIFGKKEDTAIQVQNRKFNL